MGEFDLLEGRVCLHKTTQLSHFINENRKKNRQKAFLKKIIHKSLCLCLRNKHVYNFNSRQEMCKQELQVHFEANLSTRAFKKFFAKTVPRNTKNLSIRIVFIVRINNQTCNFL